MDIKTGDLVEVTNEITGTSYRVFVEGVAYVFGKVLLLSNRRWAYEHEVRLVWGVNKGEK